VFFSELYCNEEIAFGQIEKQVVATLKAVKFTIRFAPVCLTVTRGYFGRDPYNVKAMYAAPCGPLGSR
jgi:hypothetical protein